MPKRGERTADRVTVTCPCGVEFSVTRKRYESGRGRRCSKACQYAYMERPSGLAYTLTRENPTSFRPGSTPWNKGGVRPMPSPWNKGVPTGVVPPNAFRPDEHVGPDNAQWRGDEAGYGSIHSWVARHKVRTGRCMTCGAEGPTEWANISHEYRRDLDDYQEMCRKCHASYDCEPGNSGAIARRFGDRAEQSDQDPSNG